MVRGTRPAALLIVTIAATWAWSMPAHAAPRPHLTEYPASLGPDDIVRGPDGNLWFTSDSDSQVGRITPSGAVTLFPTPTPSSFPLGITAGPDGNLWFTEASADQVGRVTPAGTITEFPVPTPGGYPRDIASGPDGNLWFTELFGNRIGKVAIDGTITEYPIPTADSGPVGITLGPDGRLWFTEASVGKVGRVTSDGAMSEVRLPAADRSPIDITTGPDGNVWVTEPGPCCLSGHIAVLEEDGTVTEFAMAGDPSDLTPFRGALWFTEPNSDRIGQISLSGSVSLRDLTGARRVPDGIASGPDGTLWFCENFSGQIGKMTFAASG